MATFSRLPIASLLCAFEKDGYGRLVLLPFGELEETRRSNSGIGSEDLRIARGGGLWLQLRSGVAIVLTWSFDDDFRDDLEDLWRGLSFDLGVSPSRSLSFSRTFEGILEALSWLDGRVR